MICLDPTDVIEGGASVDAVIDYQMHGLVGTAFTQLAAGVMNTTLTAVLYTAGAAMSIVSIILVNKHTSAVDITLCLDPANAGNPRYLIPKTISLGAGHSLHTDGARLTIIDSSGGRLVLGLNISDTAYGAGWNGVTAVAPSKNAVYDEMETKADKGVNADITSTTALTQITRATGGAFDIAIGVAAGDDFTIDTDKLVVEGDTGKVGVGTANPSELLHLEGAAYPRVLIKGTTINTDVYFTFETNDTSDGRIGAFNFFNTASGDTIASFGGYRSGANDAGLLSFMTQAAGLGLTERMVINPAGNIGIGTNVPGNPLAVNRSADGIIVDFESAGAVEGNVSISGNTTSYNAFVGSHYTQLKSGQQELPIGAVVISIGEIIPCEVTVEKEIKEEIEILEKDAFETVDTEVDLIIEKEVEGKIIKNKKVIGEEFQEYRVVDGKIEKSMKPIYEKTTIQKTQLKADHEINKRNGKIIKTTTTKKNVSPDVSGKEYFTYVDTTNKAADKRVYGVWLGRLSDDSKGAAFGQDDKPVYLVAQVGLSKILVTEAGGDIEIGDYLETSAIPMLAQKQEDKVKVNSTIAKAVVSVKWTAEEVNPDFGCKAKLIPCIF